MAEPVGARLRALLLDDEEVIRSLVTEILEAMGFAVSEAVSLATAREALAGNPFDLVLVDKNLPDGSGLTLVRELATKEADLEIVVMSGYATLSSAVEALQAGVADYVVKPFDLADLRARLQRAVERLKLRRSNRQLLAQLKEKTQTLEGLATRDLLTGLDNHASFQDRLRLEIGRSGGAGRSCALLLASIDRFRDLNASLGHPGGDALLRALGAFLLSSRADLAEGVVVGRYGGDTFGLLFPETDRTGGASRAEALRRATESAGLGPGHPPVTLSIGVAVFPEHANDADGLFAAATTALEAAKEGGRNRLVTWSRDLALGGRLDASQVRREAEQLAALERTLREGSFHSVYQPIVDLSTGIELAWETLGRPSDPAFKSILDLLGVAERNGRVTALGRALRENGVAAMRDLPPDKLLFMNVHPLEFLLEGGLESEPWLRPVAGRIVFEITEAAEVSNTSGAQERMAALRRAGFRVAVDDLGSGYSSLNSLALLQPDFVKLDIAMVRGIERDSRLARLIKHLLEYCRGENIRVVCEGIETAAELAVVRELGVELGQGYLLARPGPPFPSAARV